MNIKINRLSFKVMLLVAATILFSCETEYIDKVNEIPGDVIQVPGFTHIESFSINEFEEGKPLNAAITENSIVVLWSAYKGRPETISPVITLAEGATILPASGVAVPFVDGTVYTVTSKAGTTKQYTLKIDVRQLEPTYTTIGSTSYEIGTLQKEINSATGGSGAIDNLILDTKQTRVYFVSAEDKTTEYDAEVVFMGLGDSPYIDYGIYYFLPENMPEGLYDVRIVNGNYLLMNTEEQRFQSEVKLPANFSVTRYGFPTTKQLEQTVEVRGTLLDQTTSVEIYNNANSEVVYPLEIISVSPYRITLKIPAGTPAGAYNRMKFWRGEESTNSANAITVE